MSKTATRRAPSRSAAELAAAVERFLKASSQPALLEPGEAIIPLRPGNYSVEAGDSRITLQAWDEQRNIVRRLIDVREEKRGRLELVVERFARKQGALFLIDLGSPSNHGWERRGTRLVFRERFRQFLSGEFPEWKIAELSTEADLEHSLSPAYPRALLRRGATGLAAIGASPDSTHPGAALSFGLVWLDYLRRRERSATVEGLVLMLPGAEARNTACRVDLLNHQAARFEVFAFSEQGQTARLDLQDAGNLDTKLERYRGPSDLHRDAVSRLLEIEGVEPVETADGETSLRVRGLEFARTAGTELRFGLGTRVARDPDNLSECQQLARDLARLRNPKARGGELYQSHPEAWLESQVRSGIEIIDPTLVSAPIYGQVPAFAGGDRGIIDLLAVDRSGRLAVIELKACADLHLPLQALDYWMRVRWHLARDEFNSKGYFPGMALRKETPRLLLVAPALEFHPATEVILRYFSTAIDVERIGLALHWRRKLEIMLRLRGAERPDLTGFPRVSVPVDMKSPTHPA